MTDFRSVKYIREVEIDGFGKIAYLPLVIH